jgi:sulfur-oxidizing protein SoxY
MNFNINRRQALSIGAGALAVAMGGFANTAHADKNAADEIIAKFAGGKTPVAGKVHLELPEIAENGNTVPIADSNPRPDVATFHFSPASGVAEASTRIRLAKTQNITAVAKMNDGSVFMGTKQVKVTIGGCGG